MATIEEYMSKEAEFVSRTDALCETCNPNLCDCSKCPCKDLCDWLHKESPFA